MSVRQLRGNVALMTDLTWSKGCYNNSDGGCSPNLYPRLDNRWLWQRGHGDRCLHDAETQAIEGRVERWWIDDRDIRDNNVGAWSPQPAHSDTITFSDTTNKLKLLWKFCWWLANMQPRITSARHDRCLLVTGGGNILIKLFSSHFSNSNDLDSESKESESVARLSKDQI